MRRFGGVLRLVRRRSGLDPCESQAWRRAIASRSSFSLTFVACFPTITELLSSANMSIACCGFAPREGRSSLGRLLSHHVLLSFFVSSLFPSFFHSLFRVLLPLTRAPCVRLSTFSSSLLHCVSRPSWKHATLYCTSQSMPCVREVELTAAARASRSISAATCASAGSPVCLRASSSRLNGRLSSSCAGVWTVLQCACVSCLVFLRLFWSV